MEKRDTLAQTHSEYCQALYAVSASIKFFISTHDNSTSLKQNPESIPLKTHDSSKEPQSHEAKEHVHSQLYTRTPPPMPSPQMDSGLEFFTNPFADVINGCDPMSSDDQKVEIEEQSEVRSSSLRKWELVDALKDVEHCFNIAYDAATDVYLGLGQDEIDEKKAKLKDSITLQQSPLFESSRRSLRSSFRTSSLCGQPRSVLLDNYAQFDSKSYTQTLKNLYLWEKKLFEEIQVVHKQRKRYERTCSRLKNQCAAVGKVKEAKDEMESKMRVSIQSAKAKKATIQNIVNKELEPQYTLLLRSQSKAWRIMLESHKTQKKTLDNVTSFSFFDHQKSYNESQRMAALKVEAEFQNWHKCFDKYIAAQKAFVEVLHGWLSKFTTLDMDFNFNSQAKADSPPLLKICSHWLLFMKRLPQDEVAFAMKTFEQHIRTWIHQGEELVDSKKDKHLLDELQYGFFIVFQSLTNFSKALVKMYSHLLS
ncbi:protein of unknown function DUF632 [Dillenia turbinata]|uniref:DUF632 domain-containing protein n=1 Tax=Dillenia turbinata TaxID=194707 RepID=A0AAN8WDQ7_9MAGN